MKEFLLLFLKLLGTAAYILLCGGLFFSGDLDDWPWNMIRVIAGIILTVLGFTCEIYALMHSWIG